MRRTILGAIMIFVVLFSVGCGGGSTPEKQTGSQPAQEQQQGQQQEQKQEQIKVLNLGTHGVGSIVNTMATGMAGVLSKNLDFEVKVVASTGPTEWMPMINSGEMDMGMLNNWDAQMGRLGKSSYEKISGGKGFPIMLITSGHKALTGVVVAEDSGIKKGADLKGKRYAGNYTGSPGTTAQAEAALANLGLTQSDVKMVSVPAVDAGVRAVIEGRADANGSNNVGMGVISELDASKGARFLSFDPSPEAVKRLQEKFPATVVKVSPGEKKTGIREDTYLMSYDFYLVGRESLPEDTVYNVVKTLWEKNKDITVINKNLEDWTPENFVNTTFTIPYHPGAIKFYKEKGVWTPEMEKLNQELLSAK